MVAVLQEVCGRHDPEFHPKFKQWCDDYFLIKHRQVAADVRHCSQAAHLLGWLIMIAGLPGVASSHLSDRLCFCIAVQQFMPALYILSVQIAHFCCLRRGWSSRELCV